jgi:hypothetical protein
MVRLRRSVIPSLLVAMSALTRIGHAQGANAAPPPGVLIPADVQKTMDQIGDLDLLVALTPLRLSKEQADKAAAALEAIARSGGEIDAQGNASIRAVAADVAKARADGLAGTPPDSDATARINKALDEIGKRAAATHTAAINRAVTALKDILTPEQVKAIKVQYAGWVGGKITVPGKYRDDPEKQKAYINDMALGAFTERILLNQRAIGLLHVIKSPSPAAPTTAAPVNP